MDVQIGEREHRPELLSRRSNRVPRAPIDNHSCSNHMCTRFLQRIDCSQHATACCRRVLDRQYPTSCHIGTFDPPLKAVCLSLLAYNESVQRPASLVRRVQHGCCHRVRPEGQAADRVEVPFIDEVQHDLPHEWSTGVMQGQSAEVHVEVCLHARRQHHSTPHYC